MSSVFLVENENNWLVTIVGCITMCCLCKAFKKLKSIFVIDFQRFLFWINKSFFNQ